MSDQAARIGPYELVRRLGRGGMAETYLARRRGPGGFVQECCLKRVLPEHADDAQFRDQFLDEATIHGRLQHGNIVRVSDFGEHEGTYFLVMELVDGCDLAELLEDARRAGEGLPLPLAVTIAADLCQALAYAHGLHDEQGALELVHRDLTPSNVLLTRAGEVKLSDFGIARAAQRRHRTQTGYTKGKFCYMSPEQIEARADLDGRSDLFSLGCVLYEMLAGARPFDAPSGNDLAVLPRILEGSFEPLPERVPGVPAPLASLVHALLAREPGDRPDDAQAALEALAPLLPPVTVRTELAGRVRRLCEAREAARPAQAPEPPTAAVDLSAETRQAFLGEPTQPALTPAADGSAAAARASTELGEPRRRPSLRALATLGASLVLFALVVLGLALRPDRPALPARAQQSQEVGPQAGASPQLAQPSPSARLPAREAEAAAPRPAAEQGEAPGTSDSASAPDERLQEGAAAPAPAERVQQRGTDEPSEAPRPSELRVVVVPYGTIWIDGKRRGRTRVRATLPPGRHRIGIGRGDTPTRSQEVMLEPGRRTLEFALDGSFE